MEIIYSPESLDDLISIYSYISSVLHEPDIAEAQVKSRHIERKFKNPNPEFYEEISGISFQREQLYEPPFGLCNISQDETAVAQLLRKTAEYAKGIADPPYLLKEALQDAYMAILMRQSDELGKLVKSEKQIWM